MTEYCAVVLMDNCGDIENPASFGCNQAAFMAISDWGAMNLQNCGIDDVCVMENANVSDILDFAKKSSKEMVYLSPARVPYINSEDLRDILKLCHKTKTQVLAINEKGTKPAGLAINVNFLSGYAKNLEDLLDVYNTLGDGGKVTVRCKEVYDGVSFFMFNEFARSEVIENHLNAGVNIPCADGIIIDPKAKIGRGTVILPGTIIKGICDIGKNCTLGPNSYIQDSKIGENVIVKASFIEQSIIGDNCSIGPFSNLRPGAKLDKKVKIGDFVEVKNSNIGENTKISHLSYVGDSDVGNNVNLGCGIVTVNYDGKNKHKTVIGNNVFVGCNSNLVAPLIVKDYSYIAAGSTITEDVPENSLAIARARQIVKVNWKDKRNEK